MSTVLWFTWQWVYPVVQWLRLNKCRWQDVYCSCFLMVFVFQHYKFRKAHIMCNRISAVTSVNIKSPSNVMGQIKLLNLIKKENGKRCGYLSSSTKWTMPFIKVVWGREGAGDVDQTNDLGKVALLLKFKLLSTYERFFSPLSQPVISESFRDYIECYLRMCVAHTFPPVRYSTLGFFFSERRRESSGEKKTGHYLHTCSLQSKGWHLEHELLYARL